MGVLKIFLELALEQTLIIRWCPTRYKIGAVLCWRNPDQIWKLEKFMSTENDINLLLSLIISTNSSKSLLQNSLPLSMLQEGCLKYYSRLFHIEFIVNIVYQILYSKNILSLIIQFAESVWINNELIIFYTFQKVFRKLAKYLSTIKFNAYFVTSKYVKQYDITTNKILYFTTNHYIVPFHRKR